MNTRSMWKVAVLLFVALAASIIQTVTATPERIEGFAAVAVADAGKTWVAVYENNRIRFFLLDQNGTTQRTFSIPRKKGSLLAQIAYMATDEAGRLYFIQQYSGLYDGKYASRQELVIYTPKLLPFGRVKTIRLDGKDASSKTLYSHIYLSTSLVLTGVSEEGDKIVRQAYDLASLQGAGGITIKNLRSYPVYPEEGFYKAVTAGTDVVVLSKSGKLFRSEEGAQEPTLLYPDAQTPYASYASFLCNNTAGQVIIGEQTGGSILRLSTTDGRIEYIAEGTQSFGALPYTGKDVLDMAFPGQDTLSYVAVVQNKSTGATELVVCNNGNFSLVSKIRDAFPKVIAKILGNGVLYFLVLVAAARGGVWLRTFVVRSRTILVKLLSASIPLLILVLVLFGTYAYSSYQNALNGTYRTKAADQGNLLRALFASSSFDKITSPELYTSTEYTYLKAQMGTRDLYTSSAYFVDRALYTGVDWNLPSLYPFGIRHSVTAQELYQAAALTGKQQTGIIRDRFGERISCITPVGSSSGNTVFLLETGIFTAEIRRQASGFLRSYLVVSLFGLLAAGVLLLLLFRRILGPLSEIIGGLEQFSRGNRAVRLSSTTNDELADISRVFNQMAKDIDVQIYNLRQMGETYYRFVPRQIFRLLGKENLSDIALGSAVEGRYCVLVANLSLRQNNLSFESIQELTNCFFAIVHKVSGENGATLLADSAELRDLRIICAGGDAAVKIAMDAIAGVDEVNSKNSISRRLDVSLFLHYTEMGFGICGDNERYVPAMISAELDDVLAQSKEFRHLSSRLIVTGAAYGVLDAEKYFHRFIGYTHGTAEEAIGLYDFYDSSPPSMIRLLNSTKDAFDKAMSLYAQRRYYDAKNLFAVVLRENQYDNVARHYIFQCEKKL